MDLWGLDPLFWSYVKLFAVQIRQLSSFEGTADTHMLYGRPITKVEIVGTVVSVSDKAKFVKYVVDDGTDVVPCIQWKVHSDGVVRGATQQAPPLQLGQTVCVQGKLRVETRRFHTTERQRRKRGRDGEDGGDGDDDGAPVAGAWAEARDAHAAFTLERTRELVVQRARVLPPTSERAAEALHWLQAAHLARV
eukprot:g5105.t1